MAGAFDRFLTDLGRHVRPMDRLYWAYVLAAFASGTVVGLLTELWGLAGLTLAAFSLLAVIARKRYEKSLED